jgi:hypothetical protein
MGLTVTEAFSFIATERKTIESKVASNIKTQLKKVLAKSEIEDLVSDVMVNTMERLHREEIAFESGSKLLGYMLQACWYNYRDSNVKRLAKVVEEDWQLEAKPTIIYAYNERPDELDSVYFNQKEPITNKYFQLNPRNKHKHLSLQGLPEVAASDVTEATEQDVSDTYYQELTEKVFAYLEECVMNRELKFRDVGLFKMYLVNGYTSAKELSEESDFSLEICKQALSKIKKRLKPIKFN